MFGFSLSDIVRNLDRIKDAGLHGRHHFRKQAGSIVRNAQKPNAACGLVFFKERSNCAPSRHIMHLHEVNNFDLKFLE